MSKMARSVSKEDKVDVYHVNLFIRECSVIEMRFEEHPPDYVEGFKVRSFSIISTGASA